MNHEIPHHLARLIEKARNMPMTAEQKRQQALVAELKRFLVDTRRHSAELARPIDGRVTDYRLGQVQAFDLVIGALERALEEAGL